MSEKRKNMKNQLDKKSHAYIKLLEFLAEHAVKAEIETIVSVYIEQYRTGIDPIAFWGIECDNSPELRKITGKAEILKGIALIADLEKATRPKSLEDFMGGGDPNAKIEELMRKAYDETVATPKTKRSRKSKKAEAPEWVKEAREDLFSTNKEGHTEIEWGILYTKIRSAFTFKTMNDTREVYYYRNGVYVPAKTTIETWLEEVVGDLIDYRLVRRIEDRIRYATYTARADFDNDLGYIPLKNGLINIKTGELEDFDSEKLFTSGLPVEYDPGASFEPIEKFMHEVLYAEDVATMQEIWGYCLYAGYPSAKLFWFNAPGRNGKTTVVSLLKAMLGEENVAGVGLHEMDGSHRFSLASLYGCRLNDMAEAETKQVVQTPTLKRATGGDLLHAEKKGIQERFKFTNFAKFIVSANEVPRINDNSIAMRERLLVMEFPNTFIGKDDNPHYAEEFIAEHGLAGIFNWAFIGLQRLYNNGWQFTRSGQQDKAKADMMRQAHPVTTFLEEWTEFDSSGVMEKYELYEAFEHYSDYNKIVALDENKFTKEVRLQNHTKLVRNQKIKGRPAQWRGIRLKPYIADSIARERTNEAFNIEMPASDQAVEGIKEVQESLKI